MDITNCIDFKESDVEYWLENYKPIASYGEGQKLVDSDNYFYPFYFEHMTRMTIEDLQHKSAIAAELAYRDYIIMHLLRDLGRLPKPAIKES